MFAINDQICLLTFSTNFMNQNICLAVIQCLLNCKSCCHTSLETWLTLTTLSYNYKQSINKWSFLNWNSLNSSVSLTNNASKNYFHELWFLHSLQGTFWKWVIYKNTAFKWETLFYDFKVCWEMLKWFYHESAAGLNILVLHSLRMMFLR